MSGTSDTLQGDYAFGGVGALVAEEGFEPPTQGL